MKQGFWGRLVALSLALYLLAGCGQKAPEKYTVGAVDAQGYHSGYYNLTFAPPPGVSMTDQQTLWSLSGLAQEELGADFELMGQAEAKLIIEMMAVDEATSASLLVSTEPLTQELTMEQYLEGLKYQLGSFGEMMVTYQGEPHEETVAGQTFTLLAYQNAIPNSPVAACQNMYIQLGKERALCVTLSWMDTPDSKAGADKLLAALTKAK